MPGSPRVDDEPEVVRATWSELRDPAWWRRQDAEGAVLYAWGRRRELRVARAIRESGKTLVSMQDSGGLMSPLCGFGDWWRERWHMAARKGRWRLPWFLGRVGFALTAGWWVTEWPRLSHCRLAHLVGVVSPGATSRYRRWLRRLGGSARLSKVCCIPHPVSPRCVHDRAVAKEDLVVAVGRWDDEAQKRPDWLMRALSETLRSRPATRAMIVGNRPSALSRWLDDLPAEVASRVEWISRLDHEELAAVYRRCRVVLCPSAFESFHISAAEGLCSGASVVSWRSASLPSMRWFVTGGCGTLAERACGLGRALIDELCRWDAGERDPGKIAANWSRRLHAAMVARRIVGRCRAAAE